MYVYMSLKIYRIVFFLLMCGIVRINIFVNFVFFGNMFIYFLLSELYDYTKRLVDVDSNVLCYMLFDRF